MKCLGLVILLLATLAFILFWGCSREEIFSSGDSGKDEPTPRLADGSCEDMECDDEECDADFIEEFLNHSGDCGCTLTINDDGAFTLNDEYIIDDCGNTNYALMFGQDAPNSPTLAFNKVITGTNTHATLFFAQNTKDNWYNVLEDIIVKGKARMGSFNGALYKYVVPGGENATRPSIQFEHNSVDIENVVFDAFSGSSATTHFLSPSYVKMDGVVLTEDHEFVIGVDEWCGLPDCAGFGSAGANPPYDGSYIKNSQLYGDIVFDLREQFKNSTFEMRNNDVLTRLILDAEDSQPNVVKMKLILNTFADEEGARVIIIGDYYVDADSNVTHNGPCECDALEDFDVTHANSSSQLNLISWIYDGHTYTADEIEITNIGWSFNPIACTLTVTWTTNNPSASKVYYGASCGSLNYTEEDEEETTSHEVVCDITPLTPPVYFKVESWNACDTAISGCQTGPTRGQCASQ